MVRIRATYRRHKAADSSSLRGRQVYTTAPGVERPLDDRRAAEAVPESSYRADIQGLRAVAVVLVVLDHAGLTFLGGGYIGVDVFFVISGFLITGLLLRDFAAQGRIRFLNFYSRRARRILPAAALTLVATDIAAQLLLNYVRAEAAIKDSIWAAFFAANIRFERLRADYFASAAPPSPIQHFWSLAVEEQFYLVWPALLALLLAGAVLLARRRDRSEVSLWPVSAGLCVLIGASLLWAITETRYAPPDAYFSAFTRAWELGCGAVLAINARTVARAPKWARVTSSWLGLAGILFAAVWFSGTTPFPGIAAILPVVSTVLVVAGGTGEVSRIGPSALLGLRPFRFVGDVSYSFYLWHWPFLIIAGGYSLEPLTTGVKLGLVGAAFLVAVGIYYAYENPIRRARNLWGRRGRGALVLWPTSIGAVALVGLLGLYSIDAGVNAHLLRGTPSPSPIRPTSDPSVPDVAGAVAAARANADIPSPLSPPIGSLLSDFGVNLPGNCLVLETATSNNDICHQGDVNSARTMVVFGDSHAAMWLPALIPVAKQEGWNLIPIIKFDCQATWWISSSVVPSCPPWYTWAVGKILSLHPGVVVIGALDTGDAAWEFNLRSTISTYKSIRARVILLGDVPSLPIVPTDCLLSPGATMRTCTFPARSTSVLSEAKAASFGADYIADLDWFCFEQECPLVVGNTITHWDGNHVSRTYALLLVKPLRKALALNRA